jgi:hypothetical protein
LLPKNHKICLPWQLLHWQHVSILQHVVGLPHVAQESGKGNARWQEIRADSGKLAGIRSINATYA